MSSTNQQPGYDDSGTFDQSIISSLVLNGDLSKLNSQQRVAYYHQFCARLGLDPVSQPFKILRLNGKEILYCDRSGAQQLNKIHKVSHEIKARESVSGCYVVTAQASTPDGRHTESIGAVTIDNLKGDNLCNAMMKAETKAKRRATLDLLGLGILDESETETITNAQKLEAPGGGGGNKKPPTDTAAAAPAAGNGAQKGRQQPAPSIFKRLYESTKEIEDVLGKATDVKDIANLYYINAALVEAHQELKQKFTVRKNEFFNTPAAPAA